jgi:hypothetical protein
VAQILARADPWHAQTGEWSGNNSGPIPGAGLSWLAVHAALRVGGRGLAGGDTLAALLARERTAPETQGPRAQAGRRADAACLLAQALTLAEIGRRLGVTHQAVSQMPRR